jgi:hypothetical protein
VRLRTRLARRLRALAASRTVIATDPGPIGTVASLRDWVGVHEDHCGARWISSPAPAPPSPPLRPPGTVCGDAAPRFGAALAHFRTASAPQAPALDVAVLPGARLVTGDGLIITHDGLLAAESAWDEEKLDAAGVAERRRMPRARNVSGRHASLISQWCQAYYHWMTG